MVEDFFTAGFGIADDPLTIGIAGATVAAGWALMVGTPSDSLPKSVMAGRVTSVNKVVVKGGML